MAKHAPSTTPVDDTPASDPGRWGRIDADGTVYLYTSAGKRVIGQWKAGTPEEGLAHFGKKFDDLATEVALLEARLKSHPDDAARLRGAAEEVRAGLGDAAVLGDIDALDARLTSFIDATRNAEAKTIRERAERREAAIARREALITEAEDIAARSTDWKSAGDRLKEIVEEWRTIRGIDRKTDDALWERFASARNSFFSRRGAHFSALDKERHAARRRKEELVKQAEKIQDSTDWGRTAQEFKDLMGKWRTAGRAHRTDDDRLWERFRAAQDHFFEARDALNAARDKEYADNAAAKDALLEEYGPQITPDTNLRAARAKLAELQQKWDTIGYVPRGRVREYEQKISALEQQVADAEEKEWRRNDPEAQARAAQFSSKVEELNRHAAAAEKSGNSKKAAELRQQAEQWAEWAKTASQAVES